MRGELGHSYVEELRRIYGNRIPGQSDLCCYGFEKAREQIESAKCKRAGLLATQGIRGGANREVLKRIKDTGDIFFAESDREWVLDGANVHVSMVGFDNGSQDHRVLDSDEVESIHSNLTSASDTTQAVRLASNGGIAFIGTTKKAPLDMSEEHAVALLMSPNPHGKANSDVVLPYLNADGLVKRDSRTWIIDFPVSLSFEDATRYATSFAFVKEHVWPLRRNHREPVQRQFWWRQARPCSEMKEAITPLPRFLVTPTVSKHRVFV